jgi:5-hydroxyisourate hydrolase
MSPITTHILDISLGRPASGVPVLLEFHAPTDEWQILGRGVTDADGRVRDLLTAGSQITPGNYRLTFDTGDYFAALNIDGFYSGVTVSFMIRDATQHYHVPLLLSPFGYSTYRGS